MVAAMSAGMIAAENIHGTPVPSWPGVALSLLLVLAAAAVALRTRLGMTRELAVAVVRAGVQLLIVGALLRLIFERAGLAGSLGWIAAMVLIAGRGAGARGRGLPHSYAVATAANATGVVLTLGILV